MESSPSQVPPHILPVLEWLHLPDVQSTLRDGARTGRTAIRRLAACMDGGDPASLEWFESHLRDLGERLVEREGVTGRAAKTYVARATSTLMTYRAHQVDPAAWSPIDRRFRQELPPDPTRTLDEDLRDAWQALGQWPQLRKVIWAILEREIKGET